ncbi:MAG: patatin-like phospholipase family protein [Thermodesulfobacteriota bacterium]
MFCNPLARYHRHESFMGPLARTVYLSRTVSSRLKGYPRKKALVLEGGGMRGIFHVGLLQAFLERGYMPWRMIFGTSAGALLGAAYAARQVYLARDAFFSELLNGPFIQMANIFRPEKHIMNLDWLLNTIVQGSDPLDMQRLRTIACPVFMTATRFCQDEHPRAVYFNTKNDNILQALKATAALPFFYREFVPYNDELFLDGGVTDPIPYRKALDMGFDESEILVVLTRPKSYRKVRQSFWVRSLYESYYKDPQYRFLLTAFEQQFSRYNQLLDDLENKYRIDVIYPPPEFKVNRLTRSEAKILAGFEQGVKAAKTYLLGQ